MRALRGTIAVALCAAILMPSPALAGVISAPIRTGPAAPVTGAAGVAGAAPVSLSLSVPTLSAPTLSAPGVLPSLTVPQVHAAPALVPVPAAAAAAAVPALVPGPAPAVAPAVAAAAAEVKAPPAASRSFTEIIKTLALPSLVEPGASGESLGAAGEKDFQLHAGGIAAPRSKVDVTPAGTSGVLARSALARPASIPSSVKPAAPEEPAAGAAPVRYRSAYFPLALAAVSAAWFALASLGPWALSALVSWLPSNAVSVLSQTPTPGGAATVGGYLLAAAGVALAVSAAYAAWELALYTVTVARRAPVSDEEFWAFAKKEISRWGLHPSVTASLLGTGPGRGLLQVWRPAKPFQDLAFAFAAGGAIHMRPELARTPWLFRWVLKHELAHYQRDRGRGPPRRAGFVRRTFSFIAAELDARLKEWRPQSSLKSLRIPVLERVLHDAQISLDLAQPYDALIIHPGTHETRNPQTYKELSGGRARITALETAAAAGGGPRFTAAVDHGAARPSEAAPRAAGLLEALGRPESEEKYRLVVYPQSFGVLPVSETPESVRLTAALRRLDELSLMRQKLAVSGPAAFNEGTPESRRLSELAEETLGRRPRRTPSAGKLQTMLDDMLYHAARKGLAEVSAAAVLEKLYGALDYKGALLLPFAPGEAGLDTVQRLLRYWQGEDGGSFNVSRVDLPEGGHVIVARKLEPRVDLWLKAKDGGRINGSVTRVFDRTRDVQEGFLRDAGYTQEEVGRFRDAGMRVKHVFGPDHGARIFVSVKRSHAKALKRWGGEAGFQLEPSQAGYSLHLLTSGPIQNVDKARALGFDGEGMRIYDIDTGLDTTAAEFAGRGLKSVDFTNEGPEDWVGHGSHKAGISYADGPLYKGMAPKAEGRMGKVFSQTGTGASDGDIMAAAVDAMQWDSDVISLSLGSPGTVDAKLAVFFSNLTRQKNKKGHFPIVTASAGNAGPFNETRSQPSSGDAVTAVTAAAKSEDDGVPEISFYSSVGPVLDRRWSRTRWRRPYGLTALGGDVTTPPGVADVYSHGIESVKSKDMPAGPSDAADGKHTRMSGTSMSNPMVAAIAALVKQAALKVVKAGTPAYAFFMDNLPTAVTLVLMRSSKDMGIPIFFQEGGFVDAEAAVQLAAGTFGGNLLSWPRKAAQAVLSAASSAWKAKAAAGPAAWDWIARAQAVWALEDKPYVEAEAAKTLLLAAKKKASAAGPTDAPSEDPAAADVAKGELGDLANAAFDKRFNEVRAEAAAGLMAALKDDVWLVRLYAAFALANHKTPEAAVALAEAALGDADARVRQTAFVALAEASSYAADEALRGALSSAKPDVPMYAAYVLARHGDASAVDRIVAGTAAEDKRIRLSAVWLLGRLGTRAPPAAADALTARAVSEAERGNVRHVAVASLTEVAAAKPDSLTNETILGLLAASGPKNFALTRTVSKFFAAAARSVEVRRRMGEEPLKSAVVDFINTHKSYSNHEGALGQLVRLLARIVNMPLDLPTPTPDPGGTGIPGVDPSLGPVHLVVELPEGGARIARYQDFRGQGLESASESAATLGLDIETLRRHDAALQTAMPASQSVWMNVPAPNVVALRTELESRGYRVRRAGPMYRFLKETGPLSGMPQARESRGLDGRDVLVGYLDEGGDTDHPAIPAARIAAKRNFIEGEGGPEDVEAEGVSHGTHGMGIVGGQSVDGSPYVGMAPGVRFAVGKVLGSTGGSEATVMAGLEWIASLATDPLAQPVIINLSLGGPGEPDSALGRLVTKLRLKNIIVVCAAGNEGPMEGTVGSPANAPLAISVGAADKKKALTGYSSRGKAGESLVSWLDFGGGVFFGLPNPYEIVSALNRKLSEAMANEPTTVKWNGKALYHSMSGTSMAAPHTTGKLALLAERMLRAFKEKGQSLPTGYGFYLEDVVKRTAEKAEGGANAVGAGLIDEAKALELLDSELKDLGAVAAKSSAMMAAAQAKYGQPAGPAPKPAGWLRRLAGAVLPRVGSSLMGAVTLFLR